MNRRTFLASAALPLLATQAQGTVVTQRFAQAYMFWFSRSPKGLQLDNPLLVLIGLYSDEERAALTMWDGRRYIKIVNGKTLIGWFTPDLSPEDQKSGPILYNNKDRFITVGTYDQLATALRRLPPRHPWRDAETWLLAGKSYWLSQTVYYTHARYQETVPVAKQADAIKYPY